ncbi:MAG: PLP-dependent aminotransferase family protein, partial [Candidatus Fimadaptatus sp.]
MQFNEAMFADQIRNLNGSAIREIFHLLKVPGMISFAGGNPASSALEPDTVSDIVVDALKADGVNILQYGATEGYAPYRESVAEFVKGCGITTPVDSILPVTGSQQGMDLLCKALINPGDVILAEDPTFLGVLQTMRMYRADIRPIATDEYGAIPASVEEQIKAFKPKLMYIIPTFQNPTGKTMPLERRRELAALASKYGVVLAEDDPYRDLRYAGESLPAIKSFDEDGWVAYLGSFSKLISPGLRVGYMAGDAAIIRKCTMGKQSADVHTANLNQAIVDKFLRKGLLPEHIRTICASYREQMNAMMRELDTFPAGTRYTRPEGGLFIWVELPEGIDALPLLQKAVARHVAYVPGTHFFAGGGHANTFRLNFS